MNNATPMSVDLSTDIILEMRSGPGNPCRMSRSRYREGRRRGRRGSIKKKWERSRFLGKRFWIR